LTIFFISILVLNNYQSSRGSYGTRVEQQSNNITVRNEGKKKKKSWSPEITMSSMKTDRDRESLNELLCNKIVFILWILNRQEVDMISKRL